MQKLPNNRACGKDLITPEHLKYAGLRLAPLVPINFTGYLIQANGKNGYILSGNGKNGYILSGNEENGYILSGNGKNGYILSKVMERMGISLPLIISLFFSQTMAQVCVFMP